MEIVYRLCSGMCFFGSVNGGVTTIKAYLSMAAAKVYGGQADPSDMRAITVDTPCVSYAYGSAATAICRYVSIRNAVGRDGRGYVSQAV